MSKDIYYDMTTDRETDVLINIKFAYYMKLNCPRNHHA